MAPRLRQAGDRAAIRAPRRPRRDRI